MSKFKISASWTMFNRIMEKAMIDIDNGVYMSIEPFSETTGTAPNEKTVHKARMKFVDERMGYSETWILTAEELAQYTTLMNMMSAQIRTANTDEITDTGSGGCTRPIQIKN